MQASAGRPGEPALLVMTCSGAAPCPVRVQSALEAQAAYGREVFCPQAPCEALPSISAQASLPYRPKMQAP